MNFSSHQRKLVEQVRVALSKDKAGLVGDFKSILSKATSLYQSNRFLFWQQQIGEMDVAEIPITHFGLEMAKEASVQMIGLNRTQVESALVDMCENLFTYSSDEDMCPLQGDYHYYYSLTEGRVFKESTLGQVDGLCDVNTYQNHRIALISELQKPFNEYIK